MSTPHADTGSYEQPDPSPGDFERNTPYWPTPDNRPVALDRGSLSLTRESDSQMSFGERAAFEGVLAQIRPCVAVEIGTAEGGSLRRIARYSTLVHSIDPNHGPVGDVPPNVQLHTGMSADILPALLAQLSEDPEGLDFALVDGDHSYEGVSADLKMLLSSPSTRQCAILVHDTTNAEVRAGVESVSLERYPGVVYYELDFVPGYVYRTGAATNSAWGGLALILTDESRGEAYASSPRQSRYHEPFAALQQLRWSHPEADGSS
jgi:hypothetical protein